MTVLRETGMKQYGPDKRRMAMFLCDYCKEEFELRLDRGIKQQSCKACIGKVKTTHGMAGTRPYNIWQGMRQRCINPNNRKFHLYGGKGIIVCDHWQTFEGFWEDNEKYYRDDLTIDRKDSNGNYEYGNVRWIPQRQNSSETTKRRPVVQMTKRYEPIKTWESAKYASDELGITAAHITAVCRGDRQTHGGYRWEYVS